MTSSTGLAERDRRQVLASLERGHFWTRTRRDLVLALLESHLEPGDDVLDAGCGTGMLLRELERRGYRAAGIDVLPPPAQQAETDGDPRVEIGDVEALPFPDDSFDCVLLLDVLEHVDDRRALAEAARVLRPAGLLLVAVPACPRLWSRRDVLAGHRRRYTRRALCALLVEAGFTPVHVTHFQFLLFPLFALVRILGRTSDHWVEREERVPPLIGQLLEVVNRLETQLTPRVRWPWGTSVIVVAQSAAKST